MIEALALRLKVAQWIVEAVLGFVAVVVLLLGLAWAHHHVFHKGELAEGARRDAVDVRRTAAANAERDLLNKKVAAVQASLIAARTAVAVLQEKYDHEKIVSDQRRLDLLAGRQRLQVLARQRPTAANGSPPGGPAGGLDSQPDIVVDLAGSSAAAIDGIRVDYNAAVARLNACIAKYDTLKAAVDAMP